MPAKKAPKTVALVGFAATTRSLAPWDNPEIEIWGLNEAYIQPWMKRWDRWMQMHSRANFSRPDNVNDPNHWEWLQQDHGKPIYMQNAYPDVPSSVMYPLEKAIDKFGRYFDSSVAYMLALAYLEGFKRIEMYGFEMASDTEYFHQRHNVEYIIGRLQGEGIDVYLPKGCRLLTSSQGIYGYEKMHVGYRQHLELRHNICTKEYQKALAKFNEANGQLRLLDSYVKGDGEISVADEWERVRDEAKKLMDFANFQKGTMHESETAIKLYDQYPFEQDRGDGYESQTE